MSTENRPVVDLTRCAACRACEVACSYHLTGAFQPSEAAIQVSLEQRTGSVAVEVSARCDLCASEEKGPLCAAYCPLKVVTVG